MEKINACVVGVGRLGSFHAKKYQELGDSGVELTALVDPRVDEVSKAFPGVRVFPSVESFLRAEDRGEMPRCQVASVASTTNHHRAISLDLIAAGKHLLVEKPLASTSKECAEIIRAADAGKRILAVGHVERHRAAEALQRVHTPRFIEVHRLAPFTNRSTDIDVVLDLMIHDIDLMLSIVKSPLLAVHAAGFPVLTQKVDIANARFEFADGCVANLTSSRISVQQMRKFRVFSNDTYVSIDLAQGKFQYVRKKAEIKDLSDAIEGDWGDLAVKDALRSEVGDFVAAVRDGRKPLVSGSEALQAQALAETVQEEIEAHMQRGK